MWSPSTPTPAVRTVVWDPRAACKDNADYMVVWAHREVTQGMGSSHTGQGSGVEGDEFCR